jgi:hypothetical protein
VQARLAFEETTLRSLTEFLYHLTTLDPTLTLSQIRLTSPNGEDRNPWNVEMVLSYLIFSPSQSVPDERGSGASGFHLGT